MFYLAGMLINPVALKLALCQGNYVDSRRCVGTGGLMHRTYLAEHHNDAAAIVPIRQAQLSTHKESHHLADAFVQGGISAAHLQCVL